MVLLQAEEVASVQGKIQMGVHHQAPKCLCKESTSSRTCVCGALQQPVQLHLLLVAAAPRWPPSHITSPHPCHAAWPTSSPAAGAGKPATTTTSARCHPTRSNTCRATSPKSSPYLQNLVACGAAAVSAAVPAGLWRTDVLSEHLLPAELWHMEIVHTPSSQGTTKLCLHPTAPGTPQSQPNLLAVSSISVSFRFPL